VILADPQGTAPGIGGRATLDDLFRRAVARRPDALALIDPPNRETFTDGAPRRLTYAEADRIVSAMAARLRQLSLHTDAIVGLQIANCVESVLALLAVLRAGLIAMPLPLLWRQADMIAALRSVDAKALIVSGRIGETNHFDFTLQVAAEIFSIRHVCGFGSEPHDGVVLLDDLFATEAPRPAPAPMPSIECERAADPGPAAHLAVVTFDVTAEGLVPFARNHSALVAGGLAVMLESRLAQDAVILSTLATSSFAGLAVSIVPWLLVGGTLALHHPFDPETFAAQCAAMESDLVVVPGALVGPLAEAGHLDAASGIKNVLGVWRAPERLARAPRWCDLVVGMTDVAVFGEAGLIATRRGPSGQPGALSVGPVPAPRDAPGAFIVAELKRSDKGTVALAGPMVPRCAFPPGIEQTRQPALRVAGDGFIDTGYACQVAPGGTLTITGPPPGLVSVGGYRFAARDLDQAAHRIEAGATLAALPDALAGHRLAGSAPDPAQVQEALAAEGANPLLAGAFREHRP
jgi:non-ribosomal peptide synthetase component E (peptide arylation enzyme)